jgi:hypothetical protein
MAFARWSYPSSNPSEAVLHDSEESYAAAVKAGHKDTYAPEAWANPADEKENDPPADEKAELRAKLKAAGIPYGPNTGIEKLRELVVTIPE